MDSQPQAETPLHEIFLRFVERARRILEKDPVTVGHLRMWSGGLRSQLQKLYGQDHEIARSMAPALIPDRVDARQELVARLRLLESFVAQIERSGFSHFVKGTASGSRVFIGHGQSPIWRELKDFINDRLSLPWDEFNREAVAGFSTFERIGSMLDSACFAFLIMTAEDQHADSTTHARQNVVHEVGLFQGRLGPRRAIILLEEGCREFSNIVGMSQIRFPAGRISAAFEEIRRVLEREGVVRT